MAKKTPIIVMFQARASRDGIFGLWYWRLRAKNGQIVADGAEGYATRSNALRAAKRAQKLMAEAVIVIE